MKYPDLKGKRYIRFLRCSSKGQVDTSLDDQIKAIEAFAREHEMLFVDEVKLAGITGSIPGMRPDLDELIERKTQRNDFEVLLAYDSSRLTRGGAMHGIKVLGDFHDAGIDIVFAMGDRPTGGMGIVMQVVQHEMDKNHAVSISSNSARGSMSSIEQGRSAHCKKPPYAIDRLYLNAAGQPQHILRNLADRTQVMLDPQTKEELNRFGRNDKHGIPRHYIKQKDERIELIPGDSDQVRVVQQIYARHFVDGWGCHRIAMELNDAGVPSATGKTWSTSTVGQILNNPIYTGHAVANRYSGAIHFMRNKDAPKAVKHERGALNQHHRPPIQRRPRYDWHERDEKHLIGFLNEDVRDLAKAHHESILDNQSLGHQPPVNRDRHRDSSFFLKNILTSKQGHHPMTGRRTGNKQYKKRYYAVSKGGSNPKTGSELSKMIPADAVEELVLTALRSALMMPGLEQVMREQVRLQQKDQVRDDAKLAGLRDEQQALEDKIVFAIGHLDEVGRDAAAQILKQSQQRLAAVKSQIKSAERAEVLSPQQIDAVSKAAQARFNALADSLDRVPTQVLHDILSQFVALLQIDLNSREVDMELRLPSWVEADQMCLVDNFAYKTANEAHRDSGLKLGVRSFYWDRGLRAYLPTAA